MNKEYSVIVNGIVENTIMLDDPNEETIAVFKEFYAADEIIESTEISRIGDSWDGIAFWKPKPFPSWIKDYEHLHWKSPVEYPEEGYILDEDDKKIFTYHWDEETLSWQPNRTDTPEN